MINNKFFQPKGPFSVEEIAEAAQLKLPESYESKNLSSTSPLSSANEFELSFLDNSKYTNDLKSTSAGAVILKEENVGHVPEGTIPLVAKNPHLSFALAGQLFFPLPEIVVGTHETTDIHSSASIGSGCQIEFGVAIGADVKIGDGCYIGPNVTIGAGVEIGAGSRIGSNASLECCILGNNVNIHPGVRLGTRGFGFAIDPAGFVDVPQTGQVVIGHQVEIGANSSVDRGMGHDTVIGDGCKIDNLIHIGHNVKMGRGCVMAAMSGIAGSTELGDFVVVGAQAGISGHLKIGSGVQIAAKAGVTKNLNPGEIVGGFPAESLSSWRKRHAFISRLLKKKG